MTVTFWLPLTEPELAEKAALLCPDGTVTLPGTDSNPLLLARDTTNALPEAALKRTVQVADRLLAIADGVQVSEVSCVPTGAVSEILKDWDAPFKVAVS